ncbi:hypothetical protein MKZ38_004279 [Zalerion maritima]|uniref:Phenylacetaldoxime dehydratase n=1 Tax=Zalerion maritima TaxID=339359 RepID=A0AAD5WRR8_9PEZI|nr:hypothetical protein MKZ38_004279 [Zalerion maritima]
MSNTTESAVPSHLQVPRICPIRTPEGFTPPTKAYCARFSENTKDVVFSILGAQCSTHQQVVAAITKLKAFVVDTPATTDAAPSFWEVSSFKDNKDFLNVTVLAYFPNNESYESWMTTSGFRTWWEALSPLAEPHGWFLEVFSPSADRFETIFSDDKVVEGTGHMRQGVSGPVKEHVYWGSMRDRLPVSQVDVLEGESKQYSATAAPGTNTGRVRVPGLKNLTVIRSGQDWSNTLPEERKLYLESMHPVLVKGMDFLHNQGKEVGCYSCRLMDVVDAETLEADKDRTFGLGFFHDLGSLEGWAESHPTHLAIFGGFLKYAQSLDNNVSLRLFHEVLVLKPEQQLFEYVGCHKGTGMMAALGQQ